LEPLSVWLSPSGKFIAFTSENEREQTTLHAGVAGGPLVEIAADDVRFLDEGQLITLERQARESVLRAIDLADRGRERWTLSVPVSRPHLSIDRRTKAWRLVGWNAAGDIDSVEGRVGDTAMRHMTWKSPTEDNDLDVLAVSRGAVLAVENHSRSSFLQQVSMALLWVPFLRPSFHFESRIWSVRRKHSEFIASATDVTCRGSDMIDGAATCAAFDGTRTRFFTVDPAADRPVAMASLDQRFYPSGNDDYGWMPGWWDDSIVLLNPTTKEVVRPNSAMNVRRRPHQLAAGETVVAAITWSGENNSIVRIYPKP
jgi:hypothetical protein